MTSTANAGSGPPRRSRSLIGWVLLLPVLTIGLLAIDEWCLQKPHDASITAVVPVSMTVAGLLSVGAARRPKFFLAVVLLHWLVGPRSFHIWNHHLFKFCVNLSWPVGAVAGRAIRQRCDGRLRPTAGDTRIHG